MIVKIMELVEMKMRIKGLLLLSRSLLTLVMTKTKTTEDSPRTAGLTPLRLGLLQLRRPAAP